MADFSWYTKQKKLVTMKKTLLFRVLPFLLPFFASLWLSCNAQPDTSALPDVDVVFFDKPLTTAKPINDRIGSSTFTNMDIQFTANCYMCDGVSEKMMFSSVLPKDTGIISTGHLSCYSMIFDLGNKYFVGHVDPDICRLSPELDSMTKSIIASRLEGYSLQRVLVGASNFVRANADSLYMHRKDYVTSLIPTGTPIVFFCGPNSNERDYSLEELIRRGGPDRVLTTDVIFWQNHIIVVRPPNPDLFNEAFKNEDYEKMLRRYRTGGK